MYELQALVRLRDDQVRARTAATNQLTAILDTYWPGPKHLFMSLASQIALAFLTDYPTPMSAAHLGEARMAAFCRRHAYRGGRSPAELLSRLRAAPVAPVGLQPATLAAMVTAQVTLLKTLQTLISDVERLIAVRVVAHPRSHLLKELPRVGMINLAQVLAKVGPILDRVHSAEQAAPECGAAPVTRASGQTRGVYFRWAANTRARKAITSFAHNARLHDDWAAALYADARARGKRNLQAARIVARAWLRVIWPAGPAASPTTRTATTPQRHHTSRFPHRCHPTPHAARSRWSPTGGTILTATERQIMGSGGTVPLTTST